MLSSLFYGIKVWQDLNRDKVFSKLLQLGRKILKDYAFEGTQKKYTERKIKGMVAQKIAINC